MEHQNYVINSIIKEERKEGWIDGAPKLTKWQINKNFSKMTIKHVKHGA